jgi:hypothetical protein
MIPPERVIGEVTFDFVRPPDRRVTFRSLLLEATDDVIVTAHLSAPSKPVEYLGQAVLDHGYWGAWFVFKDQPFDVARVYRPTARGRDTTDVPDRCGGRIGPGTLHPIVDHLDIWTRLRQARDFDERVRRGRQFGHLIDRQVEHARRVLEELVVSIKTGSFRRS